MESTQLPVQEVSPKSRTTVFMLTFFLGVFGIHRFYVGKIGTGILYLFTFGVFGMGAVIDFWLCALGGFKDKEGRIISRW